MQLEIKNMTKEFAATKAINHISLDLTEGVYGLLGTNGAGKTTLIRIMCTLLEPTQGEVLLDGQDIFKMGADYRRKIGYLPQDFGFYPNFTVKDYLNYIGTLKGLTPAICKKRSERLALEVGVDQFYQEKMKNLSGGTLRRVGMAQALLNNPEILILDEPTAGLDPSERVRFRNLISRLSEKRLVLLSTHIVSDVSYIAKEIIIMKEGDIKHKGTVDEVTSQMPSAVWICHVDKDALNHIPKDYKVVNMKSDREGLELRILSKTQPTPDAYQVDKSLEDVFLYYFGVEESQSEGLF